MADDQEVRITLRLPKKLHSTLIASADKNTRSMNGEIVFRLEEFEKMIGEVDRAERRASELENASAVGGKLTEAEKDDLWEMVQQRLERIEEKLDRKG